ncbi:MAG: hypothetical protein WC511_02770 [Candidatus Pacearchaeota archaeon]
MFKTAVSKVKIEKDMEPSEFYYEDSHIFDRPLVVRGTKMQFVPSGLVKIMSELKEENTQEILSMLQKVENFEVHYLTSIAEMNLVAIQEKGFLFTVGDKPMFVSFDVGEFTTFSFKRLSKLLNIPYTFSKKNPYDINQVNFEFWKNKIQETLKKPLAVCLVVQKDATVELEHNNEKVVAHLVMTILKTKSAKQADGSRAAIKKDLESQVPLLHKALPVLLTSVQSKIPTAKLLLHSIEFGFENKDNSKGDHSIKILLKSPEYSLKIPSADGIEDEYIPVLRLSTNFEGSSKFFGYYEVSVSLMRMVCQNGLMAPIPEEFLVNLQESYVKSLVDINGDDQSKKSFAKKVEKYKIQFKKLFKGGAIKVCFSEFLNGLDKSNFLELLSAFMKAIESGKLSESFLDLGMPFGNILEEDFVDVVEKVGRKNKIPGKIIKAVILEFLSQRDDGEVSFLNAAGIVQFVSYLAQSGNSMTQNIIEQNVVKFGLGITSLLVKKQTDKIDKLEYYNRILQRD